ncbi:30S ribosomal protein S9 [Oligoflexia bacterium]|nr:30S ribosomal protein S9 [Oligoflexia bacterium]
MKGQGIHAIGRRKSSVARVYLTEGTGALTINKRSFEDYFGRETLRMIVRQPLVLLEAIEKFDLRVNVRGGGIAGQAGAVRHALSRALCLFDQENRPGLKSAGFMTRDSRCVERKKYGRHKARKKPQYSKR